MKQANNWNQRENNILEQDWLIEKILSFSDGYELKPLLYVISGALLRNSIDASTANVERQMITAKMISVELKVFLEEARIHKYILTGDIGKKASFETIQKYMEEQGRNAALIGYDLILIVLFRTEVELKKVTIFHGFAKYNEVKKMLKELEDMIFKIIILIEKKWALETTIATSVIGVIDGNNDHTFWCTSLLIAIREHLRKISCTLGW